MRFWTQFDPIADEVCRSNITDEEWKKFVAKEKERYKSDEEELSIFDAKEMQENMWRHKHRPPNSSSTSIGTS